MSDARDASVKSPRAARAFGVANVTSAVLAAYAVFGGLPARWWPVDVATVIVSVLLAIAGVGLIMKAAWAERAARAASFVALGLGLALVATLAITASYLNGVYGAVGKGGALILVLVAALALPYLVVLPAVELAWLGPRPRRRNASATTDEEKTAEAK